MKNNTQTTLKERIGKALDDFSDAPNICAMVAHQLRKGVRS